MGGFQKGVSTFSLESGSQTEAEALGGRKKGHTGRSQKTVGTETIQGCEGATRHKEIRNRYEEGGCQEGRTEENTVTGTQGCTSGKSGESTSGQSSEESDNSVDRGAKRTGASQ
jgi:hypothetical protein